MARRNDSNDDDSKEKQGDSDDTFGLPEIEYNPINRTEESNTSSEPAPELEAKSEYDTEAQAPEYTYQPQETRNVMYSPEEEESPLWPKIFGILLVVLIALIAGLYFAWYKPNQEKEKLAEKQKQEQEAKARQENELLAAEAREREAAERRIADSLANVSKVGVFEKLTEPTGRYYVVIVSAVDGDLIMDHAKKLSQTGVSTKIIPPYGKYKFYRLTVADGDTFASAQDIANAKKADFGDNTWVLKY